MRWANHKLVTLSIVYGISGGIVSAFAAMSGAHLPDLLEMNGMIRHRTYTHWVYPWVATILVLLGLLCWLKTWPLYIAFYVAIGGMLHLVEDFMSKSGLPFGHPEGRSFGLGLYITKGEGEELTSLGLVSLFGILAWARGFFGGGHITSEVDSIGRLLKALFTLGGQ